MSARNVLDLAGIELEYTAIDDTIILQAVGTEAIYDQYCIYIDTSHCYVDKVKIASVDNAGNFLCVYTHSCRTYHCTYSQQALFNLSVDIKTTTELLLFCLKATIVLNGYFTSETHNHSLRQLLIDPSCCVRICYKSQQLIRAVIV